MEVEVEEVEKVLSVRAQQDVHLIQAALQGNKQAYEDLWVSYHKSVYHLVLKMVRNPEDAEDLTSEAFTKAFRHLARYRPDFAFSTWLFRIATNGCIDALRRKKLKTLSFNAPLSVGEGESVLFDAPDQQPNPQEAYIRQQRIDLMQEVVTLLPPKYAHLVRLRYFQELSYDEIALELQAPLGTIKAQLFRARELMLDLVKDSKTAI
ncbi:sigma-70 family RNA polymerase sigma factor [Hymenobacter sp. YC55]|uniref:RNA polymerase sigma factor n=1 Tax=Hymenobacter sp. YC55 TaxID=3034019 RepID=UPI0023F62FC7|nr:sigma-70 family RNA polymerase sigma factor [Hymenobacter sp. YC55]MDF7815436.1 sigma-70 family RNA polymerase sigma factor [Hymenobacter sp. YC55]